MIDDRYPGSSYLSYLSYPPRPCPTRLSRRYIKCLAVETSRQAALHVAIEHLREGLQVLGFGWTYLYVNETAARHGHKPVHELLGRTITSCYPGIEHTEAFAAMRRVME